MFVTGVNTTNLHPNKIKMGLRKVATLDTNPIQKKKN